MTKQEYEQVMKIIKSFMHIDYLSNGSCKNVLDNNGLIYVEKELEGLVNGKSTKKK